MKTFILKDTVTAVPEDTEKLIIDCTDTDSDYLHQHLYRSNLSRLKEIEISDRSTVLGVLPDSYAVYHKHKNFIIYVPQFVTELYIPPFISNIYIEDSNHIKKFHADENNPHMSSEQGLILNKNKTRLDLCPPVITSLTLPPQIEQIQFSAFRLCRNTLKELIQPDSSCLEDMTGLKDLTALEHLHIGMFTKRILSEIATESPCLKSITVSEYNPYFTAEDGVLYSKDKAILYRCPSAKTGTFAVPDETRSLSTNAFASSSLSGITMHHKIRKHPKAVFDNCLSLKELTVSRHTLLKEYYNGEENKCLMIWNCPQMERLCIKGQQDTVITDKALLTDESFYCLPLLYTILVPECGKLTPKQAIAELCQTQMHVTKMLTGCYHENPENTIAAVKTKVKHLAMLAANENDQDFMHILTENKLLKKSHVDSLLSFSIENKRPELTVMLLDYKSKHIRYKDPADKLCL